MNSSPLAYLILLLCTFLIASCGPAQRTADGDCYYAGKGALQVLGTLGDATAEWAEAESERLYQQNQIELAKLTEELRRANIERLVSDYEYAVATNNTYKAIRLENEINLLGMKADRAERLIDSIERHQERQQQNLSSGPRTSLSQMVDESGNCD